MKAVREIHTGDKQMSFQRSSQCEKEPPANNSAPHITIIPVITLRLHPSRVRQTDRQLAGRQGDRPPTGEEQNAACQPYPFTLLLAQVFTDRESCGYHSSVQMIIHFALPHPPPLRLPKELSIDIRGILKRLFRSISCCCTHRSIHLRSS